MYVCLEDPVPGAMQIEQLERFCEVQPSLERVMISKK